MDIQIRQATINDVKDILSLWRELIDYHVPMDPYFEMNKDAEVHFEKYMKAHIEPEDGSDTNSSMLFIAEDTKSHAIVGFIMGSINSYPPVFKYKQYGCISDICVTESYRNRKIGADLVDNAKKWCRERGIQRIQMHAATSNPVSRSFWKKMGFKPVLEQMYYQQ